MGGGVKLPLPDQGNLQPPQKIRNPNFFGDFSRAHLLSNHSSRLICNADNSWNILTKSSQSLHWKYQISNKNCENGNIIIKLDNWYIIVNWVEKQWQWQWSMRELVHYCDLRRKTMAMAMVWEWRCTSGLRSGATSPTNHSFSVLVLLFLSFFAFSFFFCFIFLFSFSFFCFFFPFCPFFLSFSSSFSFAFFFFFAFSFFFFFLLTQSLLFYFIFWPNHSFFLFFFDPITLFRPNHKIPPLYRQVIHHCTALILPKLRFHNKTILDLQGWRLSSEQGYRVIKVI